MSCQKGNATRKRPQKHQNVRKFRNDLHDTNIRTKRINATQVENVCEKCKHIIEWKIKYKKYKPLIAPKSCNKCSQRTVKKPYHTICSPCAQKESLCPKCGIVNVVPQSEKDSSDKELNEAQEQSESDTDSSDHKLVSDGKVRIKDSGPKQQLLIHDGSSDDDIENLNHKLKVVLDVV